MKKVKVILISLLAILVILSPVVIVFSTIAFTPRTYDKMIYGALDDKFERLISIEEDKIVVIGGSSVPFGLDSASLEKYTGMPVVDFGVYAAIGTVAMLDLSLAGIDEGDIVILAPELDRQTMSMYFSSGHMLSALDSNYKMSLYVKGDNRARLLGGLYAHAAKKLSYAKEIPDPQGIYNSKNFNEYGDVKAGLREKNVMAQYYDTDNLIKLSEDIVEDDFIDYLNEFIEICNERGASVYFSYCPMNVAALADGKDTEAIKDFEKFLQSRILCEHISRIEDYILDKAYFYDTNYHLNDTGVKLRTALLAQDILIARGNMTLLDTNIAPPPLPEVDVKYYGQEDPNVRYFTYEKLPNGAYMITGLTEDGRAASSLTVPLGYDGYKVTDIGKRAFSGSSLKKLVVTEDTNLRNFVDGAFDGSKVTDLWIYYDFVDDEDKLAPCADFGGIKIHIPKNSAYTSHYDWLDSSTGYRLVLDID